MFFEGAADSSFAVYLRPVRQPAAVAHRTAVEGRDLLMHGLSAGGCTGKWCDAAPWAALRVLKAAQAGPASPGGVPMMILVQ